MMIDAARPALRFRQWQMSNDKWKMMKFLTATAVSPKMSHG